MADFSSFVDRFRSRAATSPGKLAAVFAGGSGDRDGEQSWTYAELDRAARSSAAWLRARCRPDDRALLLYPPGLEFVSTVLGCLYAGVVAVPAPLPGAARLQIERTAGIARDADATIVLTVPGMVEALREQLTQVLGGGAPRVLAVDDGPEYAAAWTPPRLTAGSTAVLQYTSGSTSSPKGVMVTHGGLMSNLDAIQRQSGTGNDDVGVTWLPHFHDMGLVSTLHTLGIGATFVFMSPTAFLRRPVRWLELISRWRGTMCAAPDFAYELCTRVIPAEHSAGLDLSSLRWVLNGAEPVRATTLEGFSRRFASVGFRPEAFTPCYGLAEVTLMATITRTGSPPVLFTADPAALERNELRPDPSGRGTRLVSCGRVDAVAVRIVDPITLAALPAGQVGEVWLAGDSVAAGYWRKPDITEEVFRAFTADGEGPYLRTGDLGALRDAELFITGRLKDVLVVHGRNIYPQDIEYLVRDIHPALAAGTGAVIGVSGDREHVVVIHETKKALLDGVRLDELAARIRVTVATSFDLPAPSVVLTGRGAVLRTTSGKVQRRLMRALFLTDRLATLHEEISPAVQALRAARAQGQETVTTMATGPGD